MGVSEEIKAIEGLSESKELAEGVSSAAVIGMNKPKVSILVPTYNASKFLRKCMDRLVTQSLNDIEIICINDGSTDDSADILAEYAAADGRVRIITKENSGYGDSMNVGVQAAQGEWIGICEPDDFVSRRMFEVLVEAGEFSRCDLVKSNYYEHSESRFIDAGIDSLEGYPYESRFSPRNRPDIVIVPPTIWTAIYRRSMILDNGISFSTTPGASFQDTSFGHQCWIAAKSAYLVNRRLYHYRVDNDASSSKSGSKVFEVCGEYARTFEFLRSREKEFPGSLKTFGPWLNVVRQGGYLWNYNRISADHHLEFAERWRKDNQQQLVDYLLDETLMTPEYREILAQLREGAEAFCARYPEEIPVPPIK